MEYRKDFYWKKYDFMLRFDWEIGIIIDKTNNQRAKKEEVSPIFCVQNSIFMETAVSFWKVLRQQRFFV